MSHKQLKKDFCSDLWSENEEICNLHNTATEPLPLYQSSEESREPENHEASYNSPRKQRLVWNMSEQMDKSSQRRMISKFVVLFESIDGCEGGSSTTSNGA